MKFSYKIGSYCKSSILMAFFQNSFEELYLLVVIPLCSVKVLR